MNAMLFPPSFPERMGERCPSQVGQAAEKKAGEGEVENGMVVVAEAWQAEMGMVGRRGRHGMGLSLLFFCLMPGR